MLIDARNLSFRHPAAEHPALINITVSVNEGELCAVTGVNGSGKSSLLGVLAGIYDPEAGSLTVDGCRLPEQSRELAKHVALVPQDPDVYILGSLVEEDLLLSLDPKDTAARDRAMELAQAFGLHKQLRQPVHTLSYGQKRKLCLASALAGRPRLLLLDEPFAGLDHPSAMAMRRILRQNREAGLTQVVVAHELDLLADIADVFLVLCDGRVACAGVPDAVYPHLLKAGVRPPCWWFAHMTAPAWSDDQQTTDADNS